jgi:hypothetical protein
MIVWVVTKHFVTTQTIIYFHSYYHYKNILLQLKLSYTFTVITTTKTFCYNSNYHIPSQILPLQKHCVTTQTIIYLHRYYHYKNIVLQLKLSYTFTVITTTKTFCYNSNYHIPSQLLPLQKHCVTTQTIIYLHSYYHYKNIVLQLKLSYTFTVITTTKTLWW